MASIFSPYPFLFFSILFIVPSSSTSLPQPHGLVLPLLKDQSTIHTQYITRIFQRTPLVPVSLTFDLGGDNLWVDCGIKEFASSSYKSVGCGSKTCSVFSRGGGCQDCHGGPRPGCNMRTCMTTVRNYITDHLTGGELGEDAFALQSINGSNSKAGPLVTVKQLLFACGEAPQLEGTPNAVHGMAGFGRGKLGLPSLLTNAFNLPNKFAICLSHSTRSNGIVFIGEKPYVLRPNRDVSVYLLYTPLVLNPFSFPGAMLKDGPSNVYWIQVTSIKIDGETVPINATLLNIDKQGFGGTKISTVHPYTIMHRSIYKAVTNAYVKKLAHIPRVKSVAPFEVCYKSKSLPETQVGPSSPFVDFVMHSEFVWWRMYGANNLVRVNKDVLCLGILDGGESREIGIIIGAHHIEDNLLQFDLVSSRFGFTSSLLGQNSTCANFDF